MMRLMLAAVTALTVSCASAPQEMDSAADQPVALDPVGSYTFSTVVQGTPVDGRMRITGSPGSYGGNVYTGMTGEIPITSVAVDGQVVRIDAQTPDGPVEVRLTFSGESFRGTWSLGPETGSIQGRRVSG